MCDIKKSKALYGLGAASCSTKTIHKPSNEFMKTEIIQFKDLEFRQAFFNPERADFNNPYSKLSDDTFVEKYACSHVWHIAEEGWTLNGVLIVKYCDDDGGCGYCQRCIDEDEKEHISMISPNGTSIAFTE